MLLPPVANIFFSSRLYKTGCYQEVNADNPPPPLPPRPTRQDHILWLRVWIYYIYIYTVYLFICLRRGFISCYSRPDLLASDCSLSGGADLHRAIFRYCGRAELSIHVSLNSHISHMMIAGPATWSNPPCWRLAKYLIENQMFLSHKH